MIVGLGYKARHGKDSAAKYLAEHCGFHIIHFADRLYWECRNYKFFVSHLKPFVISVYGDTYIGDFESEQMYDYLVSKENLIKTGDRMYYQMKEKDPCLLQWWGTDVRRASDPNYFVKDVDARINFLKARGIINIAIPDLRFHNEADYIKNNGGLLIKVTRINQDGSLFFTDDRDTKHQSEIDLDDYDGWDYEIVAQNLDELYEQLDDIIEKEGLCQLTDLA